MNIFRYSRRTPLFSRTQVLMRRAFMSAMLCCLAVSPRVHAQAQAKPKAALPEVSLWVSRDVAPGPKIRLTINTRNVAQVRLAASRLSGIEWLLKRNNSPKKPSGGKLALQWMADMRPKNEKKQPYQIDRYRSRQLNLPQLAPGIYLLEATGRGIQAWGVVNITNLAVVVKRSPKRLLAWVTDFRTGVPVAGARVALWNRSGDAARNGNFAIEGVTGKDGANLLVAAPQTDQNLVVSRGGDNAGVPLTVENPDNKLKMHFQTDRPIYRPGQRVFFKSILRRTQGRGWAPITNASCSVQVRDARDVVLLERAIKTNAIGTLEGQVDLPEEGSLGQYSVTIDVPGFSETQYGAFTVAAYRKPEYQVAITPSAKRYLSGEKIVWNLKATYYFGAAVPNATVRYTVRRATLPFFNDDDGAGAWYGGDGNLYARDTYGQNDVVADATADMDAKGEVTLSIPTKDDGGDSTYSISATVIDGSRREVEAASSVPVYRAARRISITGDVSYVPVGFLMPLKVRIADLDGKPVSGRVTLVLKKPVWNEKENRTRYVEVTRTMVDVPRSGVARATLPAQAEGDLHVEATMPDGTGRQAFASWSFWVAGPSTEWQKEDAQPTLTLKPDRRFYRPGETAKVLMATNVTNRPVLAVAEGLDIWAYTVVPAGRRNFVWNVPARLEMSPNAYVGAVQWTKNGLISDNAVLPIPDPSRKLKVTIVPDKKEYRPGDKARYTLRTTDEKGAGVPAEVAVSVVDEALLAVRPDSTPDLYAFFWAMRENFVSTASSSPEEMSGGAYQRVNKMASVRKQFLDTAFWKARVQTDKSGKATFEVVIPGNLTTWRATARAITVDTRVGAGSDSVVATRPVTLRLATPRQLVQGDVLSLIGSVNNRTKKDRTFETAVSAAGLTITGPKTQMLRAPAGGEAKGAWGIMADTIPESGEVVLTGRTLDVNAAPNEGEELSDALESRVKVVPNGILQRMLSGGTMEESKTVSVTLPADHIEPATTGILSIRGGLGQVARAMSTHVLAESRSTAPVAAARLLAAVMPPNDAPADESREDIALLARYQTGQGGWGWWEDDRPDALNTAFALSSLARAKSLGVRVPDALITRGVSGARALYNDTQLWEHRAILASAITLTDKTTGLPLLDEVQRRAENLSPYALLTLGEALLDAGRANEAARVARQVLMQAVVGPETAYLRVGQRTGWTANAVDATSAALSLLVQLDDDRALQAKLARWLADPDEDSDYESLETSAARLRALWKYDRAHPSATKRGAIAVSLNGKSVTVPQVADNLPLDVQLPRALWKDSENTITIRREGSGEVFYALETRVFRPSASEFDNGIRVFRRYDVQNEGKAWDELKRAVRPGEPVRCTVVVWPGERADALRVVEPLPASFEYIEDDDQYGTRGFSEVRDAAVVHYVRGNGLPITFRYYMRAESAGRVTALPASAEVLRRPDERGNSDALRVEIEAKP